MRALEAEASNNNGTSIETLSNFENVRSYSDRGASSNERGLVLKHLVTLKMFVHIVTEEQAQTNVD